MGRVSGWCSAAVNVPGVTVAYVGLGANLGDAEATLDAAVAAIGALDGVEVTGVSALRVTDPVGLADQPPFLNAAVRVETALGPGELLRALLAIERRLGRVREGPRFGPRTIDLDLLLHGAAVVREPGLEVPHPRLHERRFALEPLLDLDPELCVPGRGAAVELAAGLAERPGRLVRGARPGRRLPRPRGSL